MPAALLAAIVVGLTGCGLQPRGGHDESDPRSAVHQFMRATVGQNNGQRACALLTEAERARMAERAGTCRSAMDKSIVALQGSPSLGEGSGRAAEDVELTAQVDGDRARVEVRPPKGPPLAFDVVRLTEEELEHDMKDADKAVGSAPKSDWRVASGAEQLVTESNRLPETSTEPDPRG